MIRLIFLCSMILISALSFGQTTVTLSQLEAGDQDHCASLMVNFQPGYSYTPTGSDMMHAYISTSCYQGISYARVQKVVNGGYYLANDDKLYFEYDEDYYYNSSADLTYKIYKESNLQDFLIPIILLEQGDNRRIIDLTTISSMSAGYYILEIENSKKEKRYLRFKSLF